ncbi:unnamed protein product [Fraxinus pennsylvanica]|uniref:Uncharacterized protein n=1 Tax=Fraxinus pennsylvanica TaxID=56036 RepID=A0AAD2DKG7_9LAMI|nr:unnamed protein product [Fraxinus pennsylvanica]
MDDDISQWGSYTQTMTFTTLVTDPVPVTLLAVVPTRRQTRASVQGGIPRNTIFSSELQSISSMRAFFSPSHVLTALACLLYENPKYGKFKDNDNKEIYHTYSKLFGGSWDATKYALTPTKLCQRGLDLSSDSDAEDRNDTMPINIETTNSSDGPQEGVNHLSMNISLARSREKRKGKEFASVIRSRDKGVMTISECVQDLLSTGLVQSGDELHLFAAWFFRDTENRISYSAFEIHELRFVWVQYCFKRDNDANLVKQSRARRKL